MERSVIKRVLEMLTEGAAGSSIPKRQYKVADELMSHNRSWIQSEGIQGLGLAARTTEGKRLKEKALKVYVARKRPIDKLNVPVPQSIRLPGMDEAVPVDVEEIGQLKLQGFTGDYHRPFPGSNISHEKLSSGTFGALVRRRSDANTLYMLSAAHVLTRAGAPIPGRILQPGIDNNGTLNDDVFADFSESIPLTFSASGNQNLVDAAIARIHPGTPVSAAIPELGVPIGVSGLILEGSTVNLAGSVSGISTGKVRDPEFVTEISYLDSSGVPGRVGFRRQVLCTPFTKAGDSGALVINSARKAVGLHFAGSESSSVFNRIRYALDGLQIQLVTDDLISEVAPHTDEDFLEHSNESTFAKLLAELSVTHRFENSIPWSLTENGLQVDGEVNGTSGDLVTVPKVWERYTDAIKRWGEHYSIPVELLIATICTESQGNAKVVRTEPGWISDQETPHRVSVGLMQTLLSTARQTLNDPSIDRVWLTDPENSIKAGAAYIHQQRRITRLDPPKVACAYNAGGLYKNDSKYNRWKMRQYPVGTSKHADRFVLWFNDCFKMFHNGTNSVSVSFWSLFHPS
jgi:hypothetical protein